MDTVLISGGSGLIGSALCRFLLTSGYSVIVLTRNPKKKPVQSPGIRYAGWDPAKKIIPSGVFAEAKYVINLAGEGVVDKAWTEKRKREIRESRILSSELIVEGIKANPDRIESVVSASAIGWYRSNPSVPAVETDPSDPGFLGETCRLWEDAILPVNELGKKLVILRTGIVLSRDGGAFPEFARPVRFGIAPILGSGKQIISWIHIEDLCRLYLEALVNPALTGIYNAVSPYPENNRDFIMALAKKMKGRFFIPISVPTFLMRWIMGDRSEEVLKSSNISQAKLSGEGFQFIYPSIDAAFRELLIH